MKRKVPVTGFSREGHICWKCPRSKAREDHLRAVPIRPGDTVIIVKKVFPFGRKRVEPRIVKYIRPLYILCCMYRGFFYCKDVIDIVT